MRRIPVALLFAFVSLLPQGLFLPQGVRANDEPPAAEHPALSAQVNLSHQGFSPGVLDGKWGSNTESALRAFQQERKLTVSGTLDDATRRALVDEAIPVTVDYTITETDVAGPFIDKIPDDPNEKAALPGMYFTSVGEALAERFHTHEELLISLNRNVELHAGSKIKVPNVLIADNPPAADPSAGEKDSTTADPAERSKEVSKREPTDGAESRTAAPHTASQDEGKPDEVVIRVSKADTSLRVESPSGKLLFFAPVTAGSERDPLPLGTWKVNGVAKNPKFHYNPDLFWDSAPGDEKVVIPPGPNNDVGTRWIDISKEHYGIHGAPDPSAIGHSQSHGCVRLTNWDVEKVADMVKPGTKVLFEK